MKNVLIIQSSTSALLNNREKIAEDYMDCRVYMLSVRREKNQLDFVDEVISFPGKNFDKSLFQERGMEILQDTELAEIIILYNNLYEPGYENVEKLARELGSKKNAGMDIYKRKEIISSYSRPFWWLKKRVHHYRKEIINFVYLLILVLYLVPFVVKRKGE